MNKKNLFPIILLIIYLYWYHSYMIGFIIFLSDTLMLWQFIVYPIFFHLLFYMMTWSMVATWLMPTGKVPHKYKLTTFQIRTLLRSPDDKRQVVLAAFYQNKGIKMFCRTRSGNLRFCKYCFHFKPDRAHHCSQCDTCILKMDHHCQWLNTCICLTNQKGFLLALFYCFLFSIFYICTTFNAFIYFFTSNLPNPKEYLWVIIGFVTTSCVAPIIFIFVFLHLSLIAQNKTLVEDLDPPYFTNRYSTYDLGLVENLEQTLGRNKCLWLIPIFNQDGPGLVFQTRKGRLRRPRTLETHRSTVHRMDAQRTLSDYIR
ncbi:unnamed protein product [Psylliodes chrysocephalus]|uniref:Palmitoyltransferase n=1 Tax=Psylliodes chrysocephalus TaxID=3402493 RepID=A0A9P0CGG5_9CUCU|nr:unnamed protein product [Psylliodes chrysocephala]